MAGVINGQKHTIASESLAAAEAIAKALASVAKKPSK